MKRKKLILCITLLIFLIILGIWIYRQVKIPHLGEYYIRESINNEFSYGEQQEIYNILNLTDVNIYKIACEVIFRHEGCYYIFLESYKQLTLEDLYDNIEENSYSIYVIDYENGIYKYMIEHICLNTNSDPNYNKILEICKKNYKWWNNNEKYIDKEQIKNNYEVNTNSSSSKIIDNGLITNIENNVITIKNNETDDLYSIEIDENTIITNYRTAENMDISNIKTGDYYNSGKIIRNITGDEWKKECIKNLAYCYKEGNLICNPQEITNIQNMGDYVVITLIMEDSTTEYFNGKGNADSFELKAIAYSSLEIPTYSGGVTVYNLKEEVEGFMFWIGLDKDTIDNQYPIINDIEIYDK